MFFPSPFLTYGRYDFQTRGGKLIRRAVYDTERSRVFLLERSVALGLEQGRVPSSPATVEKLVKLGVLTQDPQQDRERVVSRIARATENGQSETRIFVVLASDWCNMACGYCGQVHRKDRPLPDGPDKVVGRIVAASTASNVRQIRVGWFGGEPMMGFRRMVGPDPLLVDMG